MYSTTITGALLGVSAYLVSVEVDISPGLPTLSLVGSLSQEVREARERVAVALRNTGLNLPPSRITINLSPANRRKDGTGFDLAIAVGLLEAMGQIPEGAANGTLFLGELGLDGEIKGVSGVLPIIREAAAKGIKQCIVPDVNAPEGALISDVNVRGAVDLRQLIAFLRSESAGREELLPVTRLDTAKLFQDKNAEKMPDFSEVRGQDAAKRAAEIAAAGFHHLLMAGPPGAGKSMIAKRIPGILPPLTLEESLEVTSIVSVAGALKKGETLVTRRPFQNPHHTITQAALVGGSTVPRPGVISLAHRGVLFLDELPEFQRAALDSLRQPLEERQVYIARANSAVTYPSDFMLVCAMNPCPCGYYPDANRCRCTEPQIRRYMGKVSGPVLDRIDLCVELEAVDIADLKTAGEGESSEQIRKRVMKAREKQQKRFQGTVYRFNADIQAADIETYCPLGKGERQHMEQMCSALGLSVRAYHRILKVARTIADLEGAAEIGVEHLMEASFYRPAQEYWK